jgi:hypothetical protein
MAASLDALRDPTSDPLAKRKGASAVGLACGARSEKPGPRRVSAASPICPEQQGYGVDWTQRQKTTSEWQNCFPQQACRGTHHRTNCTIPSAAIASSRDFEVI